jgi:hypothetical protein
VVHQGYGLSFWPEADVPYLATADLQISSDVGTLPFNQNDLFFSFNSSATPLTHLEWPLLLTQEELGTPHAIGFPFTVYLHSAMMPPNTGPFPYRLDMYCLLIDHYDPGSGSGISFNTGVHVRINITVEPGATVVPAPGALLLGSVGLSYAGWHLRRKAT